MSNRETYDVLAVQVHADTKEWLMVADDHEELARLVGVDDFPSEQCGNCGGSSYTIPSKAIIRCNECGAEYRIVWHPEADTIF